MNLTHGLSRAAIEARIAPLASTVALADAEAEAFEACGQPSAAGTVRWSVMIERQKLAHLRLQLDLLIDIELSGAMLS